MASFHAVGGAAVDGDDLVLAGNQTLAVDRDDLSADGFGRSVRHEAAEVARWHRCQAVANTDLFLHARDFESRGYRQAGLATDRGGAATFTYVGRGAEEARLIAENLLGRRVAQRRRLAKQSPIAQAAEVAQHIGLVAAADHHAIVGRSHDARRTLEFIGAENHAFVHERRNQVHRHGRHAAVAQRLTANPRAQLDGAAGAVLGQTQARTAARLVEYQQLAGVNQMRVADLIKVHAPQLRPTPGALEKQFRDVPQRVAALDRMRVWRVRRQFRQRHAGLSHLLRCIALLRRDWVIGRVGTAEGQQQAAGQSGGGNAAGLASDHVQSLPGPLPTSAAMRKWCRCQVFVVFALPRRRSLEGPAKMLIQFGRFCL